MRGFPSKKKSIGMRRLWMKKCAISKECQSCRGNIGWPAGCFDPMATNVRCIRDCRDFCRSRDDPAAAKPATPRWTFLAKRACVVSADSEPDRLAPLTPPAPMGLRGVWVVGGALLRQPSGALLRQCFHPVPDRIAGRGGNAALSERARMRLSRASDAPPCADVLRSA